MKTFNISYLGKHVGVGSLIKRAILSSGYTISLFSLDTRSSMYCACVAVTHHGETIEFKKFCQFDKKSAPFTYYLDCLCCYA